MIKIIFNSVILFPLFSLMVSCGDLEPKAKNPVQVQIVNHDQSTNSEEQSGEVISAANLIFSDTLFLDYPWSSYNIFNHRVYPHFDIYAIRSGSGQYFKVQIVDYYSKINPQESGYYELRVQGEDGVTEKISVDALACGAPITGEIPNCDQQDAYVFLNLDTKQILRMPLAEAFKKEAWDLGFKRRDIVMNAPSVGVGQTQGALLLRNESFFGSFGFANYEGLMQAYVRGGEEKAFTELGRLTP